MGVVTAASLDVREVLAEKKTTLAPVQKSEAHLVGTIDTLHPCLRAAGLVWMTDETEPVVLFLELPFLKTRREAPRPAWLPEHLAWLPEKHRGFFFKT